MSLRFRLRRVMLAIAVVAAAIAAWRAIDDRDPVQQARRQLISSHERVAAVYEAEMKSDPRYFAETEALGTLLRRSASWHSRRARDLRADPGFDPDLERQRDEANNPVPPDQRAWLDGTIFEHRDRRLY